MPKLLRHQKGFLIIQLNWDEAKSLGFGLPEGCVCMHCNDLMTENIYYVAALNDTMCKKCLDEFLKDATYYSEDVPIERGNYNYYVTALGLLSNKPTLMEQ